METTADKLRAWIYALLLHVVALFAMMAGIWWSRPLPPPNVRGSTIEAVLMAPPSADTAALRAPPAPREAAPPPQPTPAPRPQQAETPPQPQPQVEPDRPDVVEQERVARLAREQAEERQRQEQQERRRREQVLLEEQRRQEEAEQRERLRAQQEAERQKQLEDIRRQREAAEREREAAEQKLRDIEQRRRARATENVAEVAPAPQLGNEGTGDDLLGRYTLAIQQAVERNWIRPETITPGQPCQIRIVQIPGGEVITATVQPSCRFDELGRRSVEAAVMRAQPLPYRGYESVFRREILFTFRAPEGQ